MSTKYDVFISHKSERKPWVELLGRNLKRVGLEVFLDKWDLVPGRSLATQLDDALRASRKGILVATPEIAGSGWIRDEYERMFGFKQQNPDFSIIPIRIGTEIAEMPFLSNLLFVDFPDRDDYHNSFHHLLCALKDLPPGRTRMFEGELEVPPAELFQSRLQTDCRAGGHDLETGIFDKLQTRRAVLLCAQADQVGVREKDRLYERGVRDYGHAQVLRFTLPFGVDADVPGFFHALARSCQLDTDIADAPRFADGLRQRLKDSDKPLLLIITGFEHGLEEGRRQLVHHLRSLHEEYFKLHFLVLGGEGLVRHYFASYSGLSPLNIADLVEWPELQTEDVKSLYRVLKPGADLPDETAVQTLALTGGHLRLIEYALDFLKSHDGFDLAACRDAILRNAYVTGLFMPFQTWDGYAEKLRENLAGREIAASQAKLAGAYIGNSFTRRLYWQNLLRRQRGGGSLSWRCELLQEAGRQFLEIES
jgi:hypothetical protein